MKTSFTKTIKKIQEGKNTEICDVIFGDDGTSNILIDGREATADDFFVINSFESAYESDITPLLVRGTIKEHLRDILKQRDKFLKYLAEKSGLKVKKTLGGKTIYELENAIIDDFGFEERSILINLEALANYESTCAFANITYGQQRLTSFSVLIRVLRDLIVEDVTISQTFKDNVAQRQLDNILLGNDYLGINPAPRLILNGNTGACYNNEVLKISSNVYSKVLKGAKRLLAAYTLFKTELLNGLLEFVNEGFCQTSEEYYSKIITTLTNKITFVEIECDASSDAFQVFDSLNGKGLDLTAADRIKNIFMSWSPHGKGAQKWDALVSDIGEDYLANFFVSLFFYHTQKRVAKNHLPEEFRNVYKESANADFDFFFNDLKKAGMLYGSLRKANTLNYTVNNIITDFRALNMDQVYVILFAVAKHYGDTAFNNNEYQEFAKILQMLIVRMQVCEKSMNKLDSLFANCIDAMKTKAAPISLIIQKLKDEMKSTVDDAQFESAFAKFSPNDNKVAEFYLRHIENQIRKEKGNRSPVERGLTMLLV